MTTEDNLARICLCCWSIVHWMQWIWPVLTKDHVHPTQTLLRLQFPSGILGRFVWVPICSTRHHHWSTKRESEVPELFSRYPQIQRNSRLSRWTLDTGSLCYMSVVANFSPSLKLSCVFFPIPWMLLLLFSNRGPDGVEDGIRTSSSIIWTFDCFCN